MMRIHPMLLGLSILAACCVRHADAQVIPAVHRQEISYRTPREVFGAQLAGAEDFPNATASLRTWLEYHGIAEDASGYRIAFRRNPELPAEGYRLESGPEGAILEAADPRGAYYGVATLKQLLHPRHGKVAAEIVTIEDWPDLRIRGVLVFLWEPATPEAMARIKCLFRTLADLKFNTIVLGLMNCLQYETVSFPGATFSKDQVRELLAEAKACELAIIPYFQTMSHCQWILSSPEGKALLENPEDTSWTATWCPRNPASRVFFERILNETIELFHPEYIHLGFDEIGPFRQCERCGDQKPEQLLADEIIEYHDLLKSRGIKTIIWHDELLEFNPEANHASAAAAWRARELLPRDIVLNLWYYAPDRANIDSQVQLFSGLGYQLIGAGFNSPKAIQMMCEAMVAAKQDGMIATVWHFLRAWGTGTMRSEVPHCLVATAESAWNVNAHGAERPGFDPIGILMRNYFPPEIAPDRLSFTPVKHTDAAQPYAVLPTTEGETIFPFAASYAEMKFTPGNDDAIQVDSIADAVALLQEAEAPEQASPDDYSEIGAWQVEYADGSREEIPLRYRWNITSTSAPYHAMLDRATVTDPITGRRYDTLFWVNPHPEKPIARLKLERRNHYSGTIRVAAVAIGNFEPRRNSDASSSRACH